MTGTNKVEISEQEYADYKRATEFYNEIWNDKEIGMTVKKRASEKFKTNVPELQLQESLEEKIVKPLKEELEETKKHSKNLEDKLNKWQEENLNAKEEVELDKKLKTAQKKYSLTDEGMSKAIERMKTQGHTDIDAAASWVVGQEPKAKPASAPNYLPQNMNLYGSNKEDEQWKRLNENPISFFDEEVSTILNDFANGEGEKYRLPDGRF